MIWLNRVMLVWNTVGIIFASFVAMNCLLETGPTNRLSLAVAVGCLCCCGLGFRVCKRDLERARRAREDHRE